MRKPIPLLILAALFYGGYTLFQKYQIDGLDKLSLKPRTRSSSGMGELASNVPVRDAASVKIASFNIQVFGRSKLEKPEVMQILAETVRRFDIVAIQEVRSITDDIVPRFVDLINSTGRRYDFVIGPRQGRTDSKEQYAFIFDLQTVEVDRSSLYSIDDRGNYFQRPPFVASFRIRGPPPEQAFTFTLVDVHTEPDEAADEINALAQVFKAVRNDGRGEDDIILLGDLNADERKFGLLKALPDMAWIIPAGTPTNTKGTHTYDNILFNRRATVEFTGRAGVLDLIREYNLTMEQALQVSDHFPVWAEFSSIEGGRQPGAFASRPETATQR